MPVVDLDTNPRVASCPAGTSDDGRNNGGRPSGRPPFPHHSPDERETRMTDGKELARIPDQPTSASLAAFKAAGEAVVEAETIKAQIQRQVAGTKWGNAFSLRKQNAISEPCHETGASPVTDIDIRHRARRANGGPCHRV